MTNNNVTVTVATPTRTLVQQVEKPGKFSGLNFKGWEQREFILANHSWSAEIYQRKNSSACC